METYIKFCWLFLSFATLIHCQCEDLVFCEDEYPAEEENTADKQACAPGDDPVFCGQGDYNDNDGDYNDNYGDAITNDDLTCDDPVFCVEQTDCLSINEIDDQVFSTEVR